MVGVSNTGAVLQFGEDCSTENVRMGLGGGVVELTVNETELAFGGLGDVNMFRPR